MAWTCGVNPAFASRTRRFRIVGSGQYGAGPASLVGVPWSSKYGREQARGVRRRLQDAVLEELARGADADAGPGAQPALSRTGSAGAAAA